MGEYNVKQKALRVSEKIESRIWTEIPEDVITLIEKEIEEAYSAGYRKHIDEMWGTMQKSIGEVLTNLSK